MFENLFNQKSDLFKLMNKPRFVQNNKQSPSIYSVPPNQVGPAVPNSAQAFSQSMQNAVQPVTQPITDAVNGFKSQISSGLQNAGTSLLSMIQDQF